MLGEICSQSMRRITNHSTYKVSYMLVHIEVSNLNYAQSSHINDWRRTECASYEPCTRRTPGDPMSYW